MSRRYYLLQCSMDHTERIWAWVQDTNDHVIMYNTRLSDSVTGWVVDSPDDQYLSMFLLQFAQYVVEITEPKYYIF